MFPTTSKPPSALIIGLAAVLDLKKWFVDNGEFGYILPSLNIPFA